MQLLSSQEINHVSGAFTTADVVYCANSAAVLCGAIAFFYSGGSCSVLPVMWKSAAIAGGMSIAAQSARWFDEHYATPEEDY